MLVDSVDVGSANTATLAQAHRARIFAFLAGRALHVVGQADGSGRRSEVIAVSNGGRLNGKTLSVGTLKTMLHAATMAWADKHGGNGRSLQFVEIPFPQMDAALASHRRMRR